MDSIFNLLKHLFVSAVAIVGVMPSPTPVPVIPTQTQETVIVSPSPSVELIKSTGSYKLFGQSIQYSLEFPKQGGQIKGSFTGACSGDITGDYSGGDDGSVKGSVAGKCKVGLISQDVNATYDGIVHTKEGKIDLNYEGKMGLLWNKGSQTINFSSN